ncbi:MAG: NAD(P)-dependent glycerol-3-phosphate dehydrogenase [Gammaproteobacteria bacterium]|nr:NAD(P)-dependent glycerol-3-phosphate dehydrogenase [Gammaproteobacteria bacterium]
MTRIAVLGAGAFGTALAIQLARRGSATLLWGRDAAALGELGERRVNARYLPACRFPPELTTTADLDAAVGGAEHLLLAVPSHAFGTMLAELAPRLRRGQGIVCASKGLEPGSGRLAHQVFAAICDDSRPFAVVSGPTFAAELGLGLPTAVTVASRDLPFAETIALALHGDGFRAYTTDDVIGVELGGAAKNVLAIAVGIADGLGLGANTRAALITRGLNEIMRLATAMGARIETLMGLSGLGDMVLTCTDDRSRNRRFGLALGRGAEAAAAAAEIGTVEGLRAAPELLRLARQHGIEMPIGEQVAAVLAGRTAPVEALRTLADRPVKAETE